MPLINTNANPLFLPVRRSKTASVYETRARRHRPRQIDPYGFPTGGLAGLEGATGIPAVDAVLTTAEQRVDRLVLATEIGTVCAVIGAFTGLMLLFRGSR